MVSKPSTYQSEAFIRREYCDGRQDVYDFFVLATGHKSSQKFNYLRARSTVLSGQFNDDVKAYEQICDRFTLIGEWLTAAIDQNHFWLEDRYGNDQPKNLQGNMYQALSDVRKWI